MLSNKDPDTKPSDHFTAVKKHIERLGKLTDDISNTTEPYVKKRLSDELAREAEAAGTAVKKYIQSGGDPEKVAAFYNYPNRQSG